MDNTSTRRKTCRVCGDNATGFNFGVVSCESCKAFFRRNALSNKALQCSENDGTCVIDIEGRKRCQKCRLQKCFLVGMNKDNIKNVRRTFDEELEIDKVKSVDDSQDGNKRELEEDTLPDGQQKLARTDEMEKRESRPIRVCRAGNTVHIRIPLSVILDSTPTHTVLCDSEHWMDNWTSGPPLPSDDLYLNLKYLRLYELRAVSQVWNRNPISVRPLHGTSAADFTRDDYCNLFHHVMSCTMKQCSGLSVFKNLPASDKMSLLRQATGELILLGQATRYDTVSGCVDWQYPGGQAISIDIIKRLSGKGEGYYERHNQVISSYPAKWRVDKDVILILGVLILLSPDRLHLVDKEAIEYERNFYVQLLREHLQNTCDLEEAQWTFSHLTHWIGALRNWTQHNTRKLAYFEIDPKSFNLLLFDFYGFS